MGRDPERKSCYESAPIILWDSGRCCPCKVGAVMDNLMECPKCGNDMEEHNTCFSCTNESCSFVYIKREHKMGALKKTIPGKCKWGRNPDYLKNSSAWLCMYRIPLSIVSRVGHADSRTDYSHRMEINECLCTPENCRCYKEA